MSKVELLVNGQRYGGWTQAALTRGIESLVGGFDLSVSERWSGQTEPWAIREGDECAIYAHDQLILTGYVDKRQLGFSPTSHDLSVSGRDRAADLVDSSAVLTRWEFWGQSAQRLVEMLAKPFNVTVTAQNAAGAAVIRKKVSVSPGDTAASILDQIAKYAGVLIHSDGRGGLVITKPGAAPRATTALVLGKPGNVLTASASFGQEQLFRRYVVMSQNPWGNDTDGESAAHIFAEASDPQVRATRTLIIRPEGQTEAIQLAKNRAQWEATVRAARAGTLEVSVQGWAQADGTLWPVNALVSVDAPQVGIEGDMLITQARYQLSNEGGTVTTLSLKRPDAFAPEPVIGPSPWEELSDVS